jgi:hypothetical protein
MLDKMNIRKKAMDSMMGEKPSLPMKKKPEVPGEEQASGGFEAMMVSPEEKAMILEMRGQGGQEVSEEA